MPPFLDPKDMLRGKPLRGWSGTFFHSANMTFAIWEIGEDAVDLHEHAHPQEEVWNVVEGQISINVEGQEQVVRSGSAVVVPPHARHSARPLGRCRAIVTDWPLRTSLPGVPRASVGEDT